MPDQVKPEGAVDAPVNDDKRFFTSEDVRALLDKRDKALTAKFESALGKIEELLKRTATEAESKPADPALAIAARVEEDPKYKGLLKRFADTEATVAAERKARVDAEARSADQRMRAQLAEALGGHGVETRNIKHAVGFLVDVEKRVRVGEDGEIVFRDGADDVDLATGVKGWAKSDDAKLYLAPIGARGSGDRPAGKPPSKPSAAPTREELALRLQEALSGGNLQLG